MERLRLHQVIVGLAPWVLGKSAPGMGVWVQGCSLKKCPGCTSPETWDADQGHTVSVARLIALAQQQPMPPQRLSISGGEPCDQLPAVLALIRAFRVAFPTAEIVLYSGHRAEVLRRDFPALFAPKVLDVLIAGPFVQTRPATVLAGSDNQTVLLLSAWAEAAYHGWQQQGVGNVQLVRHPNPEQLILVGIPRPPATKQPLLPQFA